MKKILAIVFILIMVLSSTATLAAGKLDVVQENFYAVGDSWITGYLFAKIENIGDRPIKVNAGVLEIYDKEGNPITSSDYMYKFAEYLEPGDYTYAYFSTSIENATLKDIDDYSFVVTGKSDNSYKSHRLPVETKFVPDVADGYISRNYMYASITNDSKETAYNVGVVIALLDKDDNIIYMDYNSFYNNVGIPPENTIDIRLDVGSKFMDMIKEKGLEPTKVDAIAFINIKND